MILLSCLWTVLFLNVVNGDDETRFCDNYEICLKELETAQRACLEEETKIDKFTDNEFCNLTKYRMMHEEIGNLQMRKTEVIRDCVAKNVDKGVSFLASEQERKCLNKASKVNKFIALHASPTTSSNSDHSTKHKRKGKKNKVDGKKDECHSRRKFLHVKCNQVSICCSIATDCHLSARLIQQQINDRKKELKSLKKSCQKSIAII